MNERDWSLSDLARRMVKINGLTTPQIVEQTQLNMLALKLLRASERAECGKQVVLGDQAEGFARAFGTSAEMWNNIHEAWKAED